MFDIGATELLLIAVVALVVIGPKDLPRVMRTVGNWVGKARATTRHFRTGIDTMIREAELDEEKKRWESENERIMREHPAPVIDADAPAVSAQEAPPPAADPALTASPLAPPASDKPPRPSKGAMTKARSMPAKGLAASPTLPPESAEPEFGFESTRPEKAG